MGGTPPPGPTATVTKAPADAFQPEAGPSSIHPNPRVKLSYRTFSISNVDATNVLLSGYQLDVFPLSRRFFRLGAPGTTASIDFASGATGIYGRGVDVGAEFYTGGRLFLSGSIGWLRATWLGPDVAALNKPSATGLVCDGRSIWLAHGPSTPAGR